MAFVDFSAVKEQVSFAEAIKHLQLSLKPSGNQWRGACPACNTGGDRALVVTEGKGFFCFAMKRGGDQIALAAHILDVSAKDAAEVLAERAGIVQGKSTVPGTVPRNSSQERAGEETQKLQPLSYLEHDHEAVHGVGFDPEFCKRHGIGYAPKGIARGHVLIPFRDEQGVLLGYVGVTECWLPTDFQTNVVKLRRA